MIDDERDLPADAFVDVPTSFNDLSRRIIGMAITVHREVGPGLPEEAYELAMELELMAAGVPYSRQHIVPVSYRGVIIARPRLDFLIDSRLVLELKSADCLSLVHRFQTHRYLLILNLPLGLLINFNVPLLRDGIQRIVRRI